MPTLIAMVLALAGAPPAAFSGPGSHAAPAAATELRVDLDGDGRPDRVAFFPSPDHARGVVRVETAAGVSWTSGLYPAWKAIAGHLERGRAHVLLGTWSERSRFAGVGRHRAVWVLGWDGARLVETWRGSALGRPFEDLALADRDGDGVDELLATERAPTAGATCALAAYRWNGFGFTGRGRTPTPCPATPEIPR